MSNSLFARDMHEKAREPEKYRASGADARSTPGINRQEQGHVRMIVEKTAGRGRRQNREYPPYIKPVISHQFPLDEINESFRMAANLEESVKVIVKP